MSTRSILTGTAIIVYAVASVSSNAFAWHPKGQIDKYVQNVTQNGQIMDADTASDAVAAKPGDVLKYTIVVKNVAPSADKQYNDLTYVTIEDKLPAGVEMSSGAQEFKKDFGKQIIKPGAEVKVEFTATVKKDVKHAQLIDNKACYEGNSVVKDNKQQGCDNAVIKTDVPEHEVPVTPAAPDEPVVKTSVTVAPQTPAELPRTGMGSVMGIGLAIVTFVVTSVLGRSSIRLR